jgi:UDP-N-acetylglucosamine:LPS N-acetylglucosamine transferase
MAKQLLFISASIGLGHITRDVAIASEIRRQNPDVTIWWLAAHPATLILEGAGENLLPAVDQYASDSSPAEAVAKPGFYLDLGEYASHAEAEWEHNVRVFAQAIKGNDFDLVIADEAYELLGALLERRIKLDVPFVPLFDFFGRAPGIGDAEEVEIVHKANRDFWTRLGEVLSGQDSVGIFLGEPEDIPDDSLGPDLPNRRDCAKQLLRFVGYVLRFDPAAYTDRIKIRAELGYGEENLILCSIGGSSVGRDLLTLCGQAYTLVSQQIPRLRMVCVCGPRLAPEALTVPSAVEMKGYIPELHKHFAACDLAIVQGGGTTTLELTALRRPFLYFPLEAHYEQQVHVAWRLAQHQAGLRLSYPKTTPESLAEEIVANLGKEATWPSIDTDGARRAAKLVCQLI